MFLKGLAKDMESNKRILDKILEIPEKQPTLIYACTVEQAKQFTWCMLHEGRSAAYIDSNTNRNIRRRVIEKFKKGEILYEQIIGRGIRGPEFGGTDFCTIIDYFDNILVQGVPQSFERFKKYWNLDGDKMKSI